MRKDIFERIKIMKKEDIKINYAKVVRMYNCDYRTVKRYAKSGDLASVKRASRPSQARFI